MGIFKQTEGAKVIYFFPDVLPPGSSDRTAVKNMKDQNDEAAKTAVYKRWVGLGDQMMA